MAIIETLIQAKGVLVAGDIEDAPLEVELLLRHTLGINRTELYLELDRKLSAEEEEKFWSLLERRLSGEPSAYITGHREFYGLDFNVDPAVLIPRPESELLVEMALNLAQQRPVATIAEIGTGCGAIAISLALNLPQAKIYATDISSSALKVALDNCLKHGVMNRICLLKGDMLTPLAEPVDIIVANLPYVREAELSRTCALSFEPSLALNGGSDGLDKIHQLSSQINDKLSPGGCLLLEIGQGQSGAVTTSLRNLFPSAEIAVTPDLSGIERVVSLILPQ
ncbi:MAG: peptide chain release factor N(5)-glutamine methyltransferase [Chloroflexi bacterium]|nr:peptide chain release factor N(5)-glutamine methyltransferase [Chloroflexota bacterium]